MIDQRVPMIIGAGPVGLAAGVFLARHGIKTRIIEQATTAMLHSKALAVNPRSLELLEPTGITERMLSIGKRIQHIQFWNNGRRLAQFSLSGLKHRYPFMLALSQAATERLLTEAFEQSGGVIERGSRLQHCRPSAAGITVDIECTGKGTESLSPSWLLGADGAHSTVRESLSIGFDGSSLKRPWQLLDIELDTSLAENSAHICFSDDGGFLFLMRVMDDRQAAAPLWRVLGNRPDLLARLHHAVPVGQPVWQSSFHIGHRLASRFQQGAICLAGDAAHIHSPIGARGMNLGIEDAWYFSEYVKQGKLTAYGEARRRTDRAVGRRVKLLTEMAIGETVFSRFMRSHMPPLLARLPLLYRVMINTGTGLDHPLTPA